MFDYISNEDYLTTRKLRGVCFGFEVIENSRNDYEIKFYFNDEKTFAGAFANGIPNQSNPAYNPANPDPDMSAFENYSNRGFAYLHSVAANAVLKRSTENPQASISMMHSPVPGSVFVSDDFGTALAALLPSLLMVMYIPMVYDVVFLIVQEKESGIKETMKIMGMTTGSYWLSWFVYYTLINTVMTLLALVVISINVITYSKAVYVWLFFWLYG